jgi:type I restriction enzyme, S subunit
VKGFPSKPLGKLTEPRRQRILPSTMPKLPYVGMECIEAHTRRALHFEISANYKSAGFHFLPGDLLYGRLRPYLNKVWRADREGICSGEFIVLPKSSEIDTRYLAYGMSSTSFVSFTSDLNRGDRPRVTFDQIADYEIPVPLLKDQDRIATRLDQINGRIDDVKARLNTVPLVLNRFRMAILAGAFSGRLTAQWRKKRADADTAAMLEFVKKRRLAMAKTTKQREDIQRQFAYQEERIAYRLPDTWQFTALNKLATFNYGTSKKSQKEGRIPVLRMSNLQNGRIEWDDLAFTSSKKEIAKYKLAPMTVLFNRTNSPELVGKTAIYRGERPAIFAGYLIRINHEPELLPEYLSYCLNAPYARVWCREVKTDGVSQSNINAKKLGNFEIPLCSIEEQSEIVRKVAALFSTADSIEAQYRKATNFANKVMPATLAKAFRGELPLND